MISAKYPKTAVSSSAIPYLPISPLADSIVGLTKKAEASEGVGF